MVSNQEEITMEMNENIEYTLSEPEAAPVPSRREMRRTFSRMALGLCLGLLVSAVHPAGDAAAHPALADEKV